VKSLYNQKEIQAIAMINNQIGQVAKVNKAINDFTQTITFGIIIQRVHNQATNQAKTQPRFIMFAINFGFSLIQLIILSIIISIFGISSSIIGQRLD